MLPTFACLGILLASIGICVQAWLRKPAEPTSPDALYSINAGYVMFMAAIIGGSLTLMLFAGPSAVQLFADENSSYRQLLDTGPWKYIDFFFGGTAVVFGLISLAYHSCRWRNVLLAAIATAISLQSVVIAFQITVSCHIHCMPPNGDYCRLRHPLRYALAAAMGYTTGRKMHRGKPAFGEGAPEGIAATEAKLGRLRCQPHTRALAGYSR